MRETAQPAIGFRGTVAGQNLEGAAGTREGRQGKENIDQPRIHLAHLVGVVIAQQAAEAQAGLAIIVLLRTAAQGQFLVGMDVVEDQRPFGAQYAAQGICRRQQQGAGGGHGGTGQETPA